MWFSRATRRFAGRVVPPATAVNVPFYIDLPRTHPLARTNCITVDDLEGMSIHILRHGNDAMDQPALDLFARPRRGRDRRDSFDFALFNEAEEKGDAVLTCGAWSEVHPGFCRRAVPMWPRGTGLLALPARAHPPSTKIRQRHGPTPQVAYTKRGPGQPARASLTFIPF